MVNLHIKVNLELSTLDDEILIKIVKCSKKLHRDISKQNEHQTTQDINIPDSLVRGVATVIIAEIGDKINRQPEESCDMDIIFSNVSYHHGFQKDHKHPS